MLGLLERIDAEALAPDQRQIFHGLSLVVRARKVMRQGIGDLAQPARIAGLDLARNCQMQRLARAAQQAGIECIPTKRMLESEFLRAGHAPDEIERFHRAEARRDIRRGRHRGQ